jgi:hypothetical protein
MELGLDYGDLEGFPPSQVIYNIHVDNICTKRFSEILSVKTNGLRPPYGGHHYFLTIQILH